MENNWQRIWNTRQMDISLLKGKSKEEVFLELKKCNGFDVVGDGLTYESLYQQYIFTKNNLMTHIPKKELEGVYEVGCGSGANLYLFEEDGIKTGGCDYSYSLVKIAKQTLHSEDIMCMEASRLPIREMYDSVFSNSVFSYFSDETYAFEVLEKMYQKAKYSIGILDIHDEDKKESFISYREKIIPDYKERYRGLPKLFYKKEVFCSFAESHNMEVEFKEFAMDGYWNNPFVFHCFLHKKI